MKSLFLPAGRQFLAGLLTGSGKTVNGIYVEYGPAASAEIAEDRDRTYFEALSRRHGAGYARIPVHHAYVDAQGNAVFTGMVEASDFTGRPLKDSLILGATLAHMPDDNPLEDVFIYTTLFPQPVKLIKGVYTTVTISISVGG